MQIEPKSRPSSETLGFVDVIRQAIKSLIARLWAINNQQRLLPAE